MCVCACVGRGVGRISQGGFPAANKCAHSARTRAVYGNAPRKILDFRPSEIVSAAVSEYKARIPRVMQTARLALEVNTL